MLFVLIVIKQGFQKLYHELLNIQWDFLLFERLEMAELLRECLKTERDNVCIADRTVGIEQQKAAKLAHFLEVLWNISQYLKGRDKQVQFERNFFRMLKLALDFKNDRVRSVDHKLQRVGDEVLLYRGHFKETHCLIVVLVLDAVLQSEIWVADALAVFSVDLAQVNIYQRIFQHLRQYVGTHFPERLPQHGRKLLDLAGWLH